MASVSEFFAALYGSSSRPVLVTDQEQNKIYANPMMADLAATLGLAQETAVLTSSVAAEAKRCLEENCCGEWTLCIEGHSLNLTLTPYPYEDQVYLILQPVWEPTPLKEETLLQIYRDYQEKLNGLLNEIYGTAQQLGRNDANGAIIGSAVRRIVRINTHLYEMLDGAGKNRYRIPMDLQDFIESYVNAYNEIEPRAKIRCLPAKEPAFGKVMPEDLELVLGNLISNALRFGKDQITVWTERKGDKISIVVSDNGNGAEDPKRLFTLGYHQPDKFGVTGIGFGLYTAKKLAELQGATLHYERRGAETCFRFETEAVDLPEGRLAAWNAEDPRNSLSQIRVEMSDYVKELEL